MAVRRKPWCHDGSGSGHWRCEWCPKLNATCRLRNVASAIIVVRPLLRVAMSIKLSALSFRDVRRVAANPSVPRADHLGSNWGVDDKDDSAVIHRFVNRTANGDPRRVPDSNLDSPRVVGIGAPPIPAVGTWLNVGRIGPIVNNVHIFARRCCIDANNLVGSILIDFKF